MPRLKGTKKIIVALIFIIGVIVAPFLSETFILLHSDHEHDSNGTDGDCFVCAQIHNMGNILKMFGITAGNALPAASGLFAVSAVSLSVLLGINFLTLISLKIRMNN